MKIDVGKCIYFLHFYLFFYGEHFEIITQKYMEVLFVWMLLWQVVLSPRVSRLGYIGILIEQGLIRIQIYPNRDSIVDIKCPPPPPPLQARIGLQCYFCETV